MEKTWKLYENQVFELFKSKYPKQEIKLNKRIVGRYSKVKRQIDILILVK